MAKEFFKKLTLGVAISLTSVAVLAGFTRLGNWLRPEDEVFECMHTGTIKLTGIAPTCTEDGLSDGILCVTCQGVIKKQEPIKALGHIHTAYKDVPPTCLDGTTGGIYCGRCDIEIEAPTVVPAVDSHTDDNGDFYCDSCGLADTALWQEVDVTVGEKVAGNWYRIYRGSPSEGLELDCRDGFTFMATDNEDYWDNFAFDYGPYWSCEDFELVITDAYIDFHFVEGNYTFLSSYDASYTPLNE